MTLLAAVSWSVVAPALGSAFAASLVEVVEAFTTAALVVLAGLVVLFGPLLDKVPLHVLQLVVGVLLLLFGMGWLRKANLRAAGIVPLHDETVIFASQSEYLANADPRRHKSFLGIAALTAFKAVLLEGLEVVFIIIAVGSGRGLLWPAAFGALAACLAILTIGVIVHKPLAHVPENTPKFGVGVMLSAFGVFWTGEGIGINWPGRDLALMAFADLFLMVGLITSSALARLSAKAWQ